MIYVGENENLKLDPYKPCPCDSGKKFKFCCYPTARKAKDSKPKIWNGYSDSRINHEVHKQWEDTDFKTCFGFDKEKCVEEIKNAHSIQNNRILNRISVNNHIYKFSHKASKRGIEAELKKVSKNKASTFFGFCGFHDTEIFKPIELKEYNEEPLQNFLFAFRALCLETHKKARELESRKSVFKEHPELMLEEQMVYLYNVSFLDTEGYNKSYEIFKRDYFKGDYSKVKTIYRQLDFEVEFAASSAFAIELDLYGNKIQDIYSLRGEILSIYVNVYPIDGGTNILISYHSDEGSIYKEYFKQLESISDEKLMEYLNYLIIQYTENVFFSPNLIERLTDKQKRSLTDSFQSSMDFFKRFDLMKENNYFNFNLFNKST